MKNSVRFALALIGLVVPLFYSGCLLHDATITQQFEVKLTDIGFSQNTAFLIPDPLSISGENLMFRVDVTAREFFTGEPFRTVQLGNEKTGYQTLVQSTPALWLVLLSKDGHYFSSDGPLTWTPEELQLPDPSERDYYKIQSMKEQRIKHATVGAPSSDKAVVALLKDSNELARDLYRGEWRFLISGKWLFGEDLPKEFEDEHIRSRFENLFSRYFTLRLVDGARLERLRGDVDNNN